MILEEMGKKKERVSRDCVEKGDIVECVCVRGRVCVGCPGNPLLTLSSNWSLLSYDSLWSCHSDRVLTARSSVGLKEVSPCWSLLPGSKPSSGGGGASKTKQKKCQGCLRNKEMCFCVCLCEDAGVDSQGKHAVIKIYV